MLPFPLFLLNYLYLYLLLSFSFIIPHPKFLNLVIKHLHKHQTLPPRPHRIDLAPSINLIQIIPTHQPINRKSIAQSSTHSMII